MRTHRRQFLGTLLFLPAAAAAADHDNADTLRGRLEARSETEAGLRMPDGSFVKLTGDEQTEKVLQDERLQGMDFEVRGRRQADGSFEILPIHLAALFTYKDGERLRVTYYCDVCAIRTYSPGMCMCCREDTRVDLVNPEAITQAGSASQ